jgi:hypothetical protein
MAPAMAVSRAIVFIGMTIGTVAHGDRRPVAVIELSADDETQRAGRDLREELIRHPELKPIIDSHIAIHLTGPILDNEDAAALDDAKRDREQAEEAVANYKAELANEAAMRGLDRLATVAPAAAMAHYADLALVVGLAQLGNTRPADAAKWFALVHRLSPNRRLDPARYLPEIVTAFEQAKPTQQAANELEIRGTLGHVFIDGVDVGEPNAAFAIEPGLHLIQVHGPLRETRGRYVEVPKPPAKPIAVAIADAPADDALLTRRARAALARANDPASRASAMKQLAERVKVEDAILLTSSNGRVSYQSWRLHAPGFEGGPVFTATKPRPKTTLDMLAWLSPPPAPIVVEHPPVLPPKQPEWYEKRWVQMSVAGGVLVGVIATLLYTQRGPDGAQVLPPVFR